MDFFLGIDIGGTKIAVVVADRHGHILKSVEFPVLHHRKPQVAIQELVRDIQVLIKTKKISAIGIGTPGPVNPESGKIPWSPNLPGWEGLAICRIMKQNFRVPVFIENDANAAALCEKHFGWGRGKKNLVYITISTGVGGGLILNGELYCGSGFNGGEIGHVTVVPNGNLCRCGKHGCLEAHSSGTAIAKAAKQTSAKLVKEAAARGDKLAVKVLTDAGRVLGIAVGNLLNLLNPELIVLGGGVMKGPEKGIGIFWRAMMQSAKKESWSGPFKKCRIIKTKFRDHVGALGAAALAMEKCRMLNAECR
ncbi:MAG: ROK family protein [Candidatus Omnitrophica bacterium]|nr:ROK family protein [Candidatus Omnitrophota bacterium]